MPPVPDPYGPPTDPGESGSDTPTPVSPLLPLLNINELITKIKTDMPSIRFGYIAWRTYVTVTLRDENKLYDRGHAIIKPLIEKNEALTDDEIAQFVGAVIAMAEQGGKDFWERVNGTGFLGIDIIKVLTAFGVLGG